MQSHGAPIFTQACPHGTLVEIPEATHVLCLEPVNRDILHQTIVDYVSKLTTLQSFSDV